MIHHVCGHEGCGNYDADLGCCVEHPSATVMSLHEPDVLHDYDTGQPLRPATTDEARDSSEAAEVDGGAGVIRVNGRRCYVL